LAAAMEMLHLATLVHDDIVDGADKRRGKDSINALWGDGAAVITGDMLFGRSLKLVERYGNKAVKVYAEIIEQMVSGEFEQMEAAFDYSLSEASYLNIAGKKTAYFFSQCCGLGAWAAGVCPDQVEILERYGFLLGLAFQIQDDILDWFSSEGELGKPVGQDLCRGIITLPLIKALRLSEEREKIIKIIDKREFKGEEINFIRHKIIRCGALSLSLKTAAQYFKRAVGVLSALPAVEAKDHLKYVVKGVQKLTEVQK